MEAKSKAINIDESQEITENNPFSCRLSPFHMCLIIRKMDQSCVFYVVQIYRSMFRFFLVRKYVDFPCPNETR